MAEQTGLEPATPAVTGRCSNQLSYCSTLCVRPSCPNPGRARLLPLRSHARYSEIVHLQHQSIINHALFNHQTYNIQHSYTNFGRKAKKAYQRFSSESTVNCFRGNEKTTVWWFDQ